VDLPRVFAYGESDDEGGEHSHKGLSQDPLTVEIVEDGEDPSPDGAVRAQKPPQKGKGKAKDTSRVRGRALDWALSTGLPADALQSAQFLDVLACFGPVAPTSLTKLEDDVPYVLRSRRDVTETA
jgi:hypothetical protein